MQQKFPYFCRLSHPSACLDSGLDFFFPPLGSRWHSGSFLSLFWFQWITFQMRRFILERSWLCWRSDWRRIPEHEAPAGLCCSFLPALSSALRGLFPQFSRGSGLGNVFYLLSRAGIKHHSGLKLFFHSAQEARIQNWSMHFPIHNLN